MRWIRRLFLFTCLIAAGAVVWAGVYARKEGFTESWRNAIEREFADRGYHVEIGKITLGAMRGLVAEDVVFFQDVDKTEPVAILDDVFLDVDLGRILQKKVSVNTLDVEDARLSLPLEPGNPEGPKFNVNEISGRIVVTESVIEIVKAEADVAGFDVGIRGTLVRKADPDAENDTETPAEARESRERNAERRRQIAAVLSELKTYEFEGERPKLNIEFRGDLDELESTTAKAEIETGPFRKKGNPYAVAGLSAKLEFDGLSGTAVLDDAVLRDGKGKIALTGRWEESKSRVEFSFDSTADLASLAGLFHRDQRLREVVFFQAPEITGGGHVDLATFGAKAGFPGEIIGDFRAERFVTRGEVFEGLDFGFSLAGKRVYLRNLRLDHSSGVAFLNLLHEPGSGDESLRFQSEIKLNPEAFRPFLDEDGRKFLDSWDFGEESTVYLGIEGAGPSFAPNDWSSTGAIDLRNFRLNGVDFEELEAEFESDGETRWFRDVKMVRGDGQIVAESAAMRHEEKQWEVKGVVSTTDIVEGARAFNAKLAAALSKYRFDKAPTVRLAGTLDARRAEEVGDEARKNVLDISFDSDAPARYEFLGKTILAERSSGKIAVDGSRVHLKSLSADVFGGELQLEYLARDVRSASRPFEATVTVRDLPLEAVTLLYREEEMVRGRSDAVMELSGNGSDITSLNGRGTATVVDGNLFSLPLFGILSKAIAKADPGRVGEGANVAREARATFRIENGVLRSDDFEALTDSFRVKAAGEVSFVDQSVDIEAVANTRDLLTSAVLTPVSELLTFSCTGTVSDPVWKAKHISNLAKLPTQVVTGITAIPFSGMKKLGQEIFGVGDGSEESSADDSDATDGSRRGSRSVFRLPLLQGRKEAAE